MEFYLSSEETHVPMILALSLVLLCSVLLGLPVALFFAVWIRDACLLLWPLDTLYFDWYHFRILVHQVCACQISQSRVVT